MKKQNDIPEPIYYRYDSIKKTAIEQHEIMLVSIYNHFREEILKGRMEVRSYKSEVTVFNTIEIHVSRSMNIHVVKATLEAMNTTAFYALLPDHRGQFFEMMSKEKPEGIDIQ